MRVDILWPFMKPDFRELDTKVAEARVALSLLALFTLYVDPSLGGLFHLDRWLLTTLVCHLIYSIVAYLALTGHVARKLIGRLSTGLDLIFATVIAFLTEGSTSPSFVFFVFAIVAVGFRRALRDTLLITLSSVILYVVVTEASDRLSSIYGMRAAYLAIAGYLIGFFGQQRTNFERRFRELEAAAEREAIARSFHDGYLQALAGISLRLESCRDMLVSNEHAEALNEIQEIQAALNHEYDEIRGYIRSLASADPARNVGLHESNTRFRVQAAFAAPGATTEQILQIILEGIRNTRRHGHAHSGAINVHQTGQMIGMTLDDDGIGFDDTNAPPWTIASRVSELGGHLIVNSGSSGAHLEISLPIHNDDSFPSDTCR
jgi:signal transduction histidine kinase